MPFRASFRFPPHATLALACSGGADSVYLAHALRAFLAAEGKSATQCVLLHANHQLRGVESDGDQDFVEKLAGEFDWPLLTERLPVPSSPTEANLRELRHDFFRRALSSFPRPVVLMFGHHLDDAAESVLMRLIRGSSSAGLAAPRACHEVAPGWFHVRPLLQLRRSEIRQHLSRMNLPWREDSSNHLADPLRNKLRLDLIPALAQAANRHPAPGLARARSLAEEDDNALNHWLDQIVPELSPSHLFASPLQPNESRTACLRALRGLPTALWRRALERILASVAPPLCLKASAKESLLTHLQEGSTTSISSGRLTFLQVSDHAITLLTHPEKISSPSPAQSFFCTRPPSSLLLPGGWQIHLAIVPWPAPETNPTSNSLPPASFVLRHSNTPQLTSFPITVFVNPELAQPLQVRTWLAGDRFKPYRHPGTPKLQDLFVNLHIPRNLRTSLPVVTVNDGTIVAVAGLPPGHEARVPENSSTALRLTFTPPLTT